MKGLSGAGLFLASVLLMSVSAPEAIAGRRLMTYQTVDGSSLTACIDEPADLSHLTTLLVMGHGFQETRAVFTQPDVDNPPPSDGCTAVLPGTYMTEIRQMDTTGHVLMVATDYRNDQGFPVLLGAQDILELVRQMRAEPGYSGINTVVVHCVSMGGAVCATAASEAGKTGQLKIDHLVLVEPVTNLVETYAYASLGALFDPSFGAAVSGIAQDIHAAPSVDAWARRSPAANGNHIAQAVSGSTLIVQGLFDGKVLANQAVELDAALTAAHATVQLTGVLFATNGQDGGDTLFSLLFGILNKETPPFFARLAGHGDTNDLGNVVIREGLDQLEDVLFDSPAISTRTILVDPKTGMRTVVH